MMKHIYDPLNFKLQNSEPNLKSISPVPLFTVALHVLCFVLSVENREQTKIPIVFCIPLSDSEAHLLNMSSY